MNLTDQVCSLELAKKLKGLGVEQNSYFSWVKWEDNGITVSKSDDLQGLDKAIAERYSAFTIAELGELLKDITLWFPKWCSKTQGDPDGWCWDDPIPIYRTGLAAKKEADARAKQLLFLKEYCK